MSLRLLASAAALVLLVAACTSDLGSSSSSNSGGLSDLLPDAPGSGLPTHVESQQVLDQATAADALPSDRAETASELASLHMKTGFARVWGNGFDYVTMTVVVFPNAAAAAELIAFEQRSLGGAGNTYITPHADIPGSYVFVISSPTQSSGNENSELCNGVWFAYRAYAFESLACGTTPSWATQIEAAAKALSKRARQRLDS